MVVQAKNLCKQPPILAFQPPQPQIHKVEDVIRDGDSLYQQSSEELREVVRKAEFWISLLEGV